MKVHMEKSNYESVLLILFIDFIFLGAPTIFFIIGLNNYNSFKDFFSKNAIPSCFFIVFLGIGLYFLYMTLKKPEKAKARLISKEMGTKNGKVVCNIIFKYIEHNNNDFDVHNIIYYCYTYGENDLKINNIYNIYIKKTSGNIKKVDINPIINSNELMEIEIPKYSPLFKIFIALFTLFILVGIIGLIFYTKFWIYYVSWIAIWLSLTITLLKKK